ncbi:immunity 49 family protein [Streptomyces sp. NPDC058249]|uniref:immunity 49 family protein n=1 Tax=Streptomyces sp. NPDC058249 TaxID=3346403 RepID=UPI0036E2FE41
MPTKISRPPYQAGADPVQQQEWANEDTLRSIDSLERYPNSFGMAFSSALSTAQLHCLYDPTASKSETWEAWVAAMQVGSALFASATAPEGTTVECMIAHKMRTIPAVGVKHFVDAGRWLEAFWLAVICRDQARMTQLCNVPIELLRASGAVFEEYIYHWVDALQTYWLERPGLGEKLVAAFDGTDPDALRFIDREMMLKVLYPPLNLFYRFISQDPVKFNEALVQAVQLHKEYWTAQEEHESLTSDVALAPLAIACLAYDAGRPIEVESEYLPENLLDRSWLGEFET